jgi:hypothetical protein
VKPHRTSDGIPPEEWPEAISDVREEFGRRQWHHVINIQWSGQTLLLTVENDHDATGEALADEFSDTIAASGLEPSTPGTMSSKGDGCNP